MIGPTIGIMKVRDEAEALALMNDSAYGLAGSVWTTDVPRGIKVSEQIRIMWEASAVAERSALASSFIFWNAAAPRRNAGTSR